jgi:hypothetical protein
MERLVPAPGCITVLRWELTSARRTHRPCLFCYRRVEPVHLRTARSAHYRDDYGNSGCGRHCCMRCQHILHGVHFTDSYGGRYTTILAERL